MIRRPPRSTLSSSSAASDVYKRQVSTQSTGQETPRHGETSNPTMMQDAEPKDPLDQAFEKHYEADKKAAADADAEPLIQDVPTYSPPASPTSLKAKARLEERTKTPKWIETEEDVAKRLDSAEKKRQAAEAEKLEKLENHNERAEQVRQRKPERQAETERRNSEIVEGLVCSAKKDDGGVNYLNLVAGAVLVAGVVCMLRCYFN
eukprot:TRINITY_DN1698_c0_g1_i2.p1 TRINITY_DN1698_c0_g1~~TRINITY_DN1698_c0_g1_i2.p1  ORF type:complete len:205 (+),score=50.56 TRINITY_DN1698_c0_g1_i2:101-715(+)